MNRSLVRVRLLAFALVGSLALATGCPPKDTKLESFTEEQLAIDPVANFRYGVQLLENPRRSGAIDYEEAYRRFRDAAEMGAGPKAHFNAAWVAEILHRPENAEKHYGKAYQADNTYTGALYSYARVLNENGKGSEAVDLFRGYLASHPDDLEIHNELVMVLANAGRFEDAEAEAQVILLQDPNNAQVYRNLSAMYYARGEYGMSQLSNKKALSIEEGDGGTYNNIAVTYLLQGDESAAIEELQTALKLDPNNFEANTNLGYIALDSGDYRLALARLQKAVEVNPASSTAKMGLAIAYRGNKDFDRADALYRELIQADPKSKVTYFNASTLHEKYTHDFDKALDYLQSFVEHNAVGPSHEAFSRMERVKASKAEVERRRAEEAERVRQEEERRRRNEELLAQMAQEIAAFEAKVTQNADCLGPLAEEAGMLVEQANIVIETQDYSMAPDIQTMLNDMYGPMVDEALAACGGGTPDEETATPEWGTEEEPEGGE